VTPALPAGAAPLTLGVEDTATALNTAVEVGALKVDADAYRRHALDTVKPITAQQRDRHKPGRAPKT
jgi:hypothetical protein